MGIRARKFRWLQLITGVHRIHHIVFNLGWKLPFLNIAYFDDYGWVNFSKLNPIKKKGSFKDYHNCSITGRY